MPKPVCKYPRQPTGPSGFGESGVRRLQDMGGAYQRNRPDSNTLAIQSGDFSRVIIEGAPEYVTAASQGGSPVIRDTMDHRRKFTKSLASKNIPGTLAFGKDGLYISETVTEFDLAFLGYTYEVYPGQDELVAMDRERYRVTIRYGGYRIGGKGVSTYQVYYMYLPLTPGNFMFYKVRDEISYWGKHPTKGRCAVSLSISRFSRTEPVTGRPLADLTLIRHTEKKEPGEFLEEYRLDPSEFTRDEAEFMWLTRQIVLKDYTIGIFAETFFRPGPVVGGDYIPKFWAVATPNTDQFGTLTYSDLTGGVFTGARQPTAGSTPVAYYSTTAGRPYQFDLSATMASLEIAAVADDAFVLSWQQRMPGGWRTRVARMVVSAGTVTATMAHETADQASRATLAFWQSIVHLGNGVVLAKIAAGFPGINHDIAFRLSTDGGASWGDAFTPVGFAAPLKNQNFGNFRAHKATTQDAQGRVLIPAWDATESAYYVWASDNHGVTWERKAKIYKPAAFMRVDTMILGDGGGNFLSLAPGPLLTNELDVTLPDRYKERS